MSHVSTLPLLDQKIVETGLSFIQALTESYGSDVGYTILNKLLDSVDKNVGNELLYAILTGQVRAHVTIISYPAGWKLEVANVLAQLGDMSTVDANILVNTLALGSSQKITVGSYKQRDNLVAELLRIGCRILTT